MDTIRELILQGVSMDFFRKSMTLTVDWKKEADALDASCKIVVQVFLQKHV